MGEILFLSHRIPFPPDRGDKIRSHHILRALAQIATVHVATFADDHYDLSEEAELAALAASYRLAVRSKPLMLAGIEAIARRQPVSLSAFFDSRLAVYVEEVLATRPIDTIYVFSGQMGQYVPDWFKGRVVVDFVDVDSAKFDAYARQGRGVMPFIHRREKRLLSAEEARLADRAEASLLISDNEARLFRDRLPVESNARSKVRVLGNGIDTRHFDPELVAPETRLLDCPGPRLIFTGQMDYAPNVAAVLRAHRAVMPLIRAHCSEATLHIVGRNPSNEVSQLNGLDGTHVWGRVDDVRPWLKAADMALVPLDIARGVQNKVLEAMAMALPVVLTPGAAEGIGAEHGRHYRIGESDADLAEQALLLLRDSRRLMGKGQAGRRFVCDRASWRGALADLSEIVGRPRRGVRDAA